MFNHTSLDNDARSLIDVITGEWNTKVSHFIGMEHGLNGNMTVEGIPSSIDPKTGILIKSIYDYPSKYPITELVADIDAVVFTAQDAGIRHYTYFPHLVRIMNICSDCGVAVYILDRPNPLGGLAVEGRGVEEEFFSCVGAFDYPLRHGLTIGELALIYKDRYQKKCEVNVIRMKGWTRDMVYADTGHIFTSASPNIPTAETFFDFGITGLLQDTKTSFGRGTPRPFRMIGTEWTNGDELARELNSRDLKDIYFSPMFFTPDTDREQDHVCSGVITHRLSNDIPLYEVALNIFSALMKLYPGKLTFVNEFLFNRRIGSRELMNIIKEGGEPLSLLEAWEDNANRFKEFRKDYLLY